MITYNNLFMLIFMKYYIKINFNLIYTFLNIIMIFLNFILNFNKFYYKLNLYDKLIIKNIYNYLNHYHLHFLNFLYIN